MSRNIYARNPAVGKAAKKMKKTVHKSRATDFDLISAVTENYKKLILKCKVE